MSPRPIPDCVQCKAAEAVTYGFFSELGSSAKALPWCWTCASEIVPLLLHYGFIIALHPADKPPSLLICEYGQECPRICAPGKRACPDHLRELEEVYAGKESGASVDPSQTDEYGTGPLFDITPAAAGSKLGGYDR